MSPKAHPKAQMPGLHLFLMDSGFRVSVEDKIVEFLSASRGSDPTERSYTARIGAGVPNSFWFADFGASSVERYAALGSIQANAHRRPDSLQLMQAAAKPVSCVRALDDLPRSKSIYFQVYCALLSALLHSARHAQTICFERKNSRYSRFTQFALRCR